jgi:4-amino-4-deoxy-L-arabinose transferase-like glycosyltransferase
MLRVLKTHWDWLLCGLVLLSLGLFLLGHDVLGLNGYVATVLGVVAALLATLVGFVMATLVLPMVGLITAVIGAFVGVVTVVLAFIVGGIFTPIAAFVVGMIYSLLGWLATTWLGSLLMPVYSTVGPLVLKIAPWLTTSKFAIKFYDWLDDQPWWPETLVMTPKSKPKTKPAAKHTRGKGKPSPRGVR